MKYGDFTSLVQLGVGLHVGTALLQLYGELGVEPLARVLERTRSLFAAPEEERPPKPIEEELERLESRYEIFKIRLFQEYRKYVFFNLGAAGILAVILITLAFKTDDPITDGWEWTAIMMSALSVLPGPLSLIVLWIDANRQVKPMRKTADELEMRATRSIAQR
jgi:hypothetical protein